MIEHRAELTPEHLAAVTELEQRTLALDGGRLKLEWSELRSRPTDRVRDLLWWDGGLLAGFLGLYEFGAGAVELAGMVDPVRRRRGIGAALLDAALDRVRSAGSGRALLVCPRSSAGGAALAARRRGVLDHCEHALVLTGRVRDGPADPTNILRQTRPADRDAIALLLRSGFGEPPEPVDAPVCDEDGRHLVLERGNEVVGYLRTTLDHHDGGIYGFVVAPHLRGRGIGRDMLRRTCRRLADEGATRIGLEVAVDNDRARGLYLSLGFDRVSTEDYFALPSAGEEPPADRIS